MKSPENAVAFIVATLMAKIKELPDGTRTTTSRLVSEVGFHFCDWDKQLFEIHHALFEAAEAENIYLDRSHHEGLTEGLPFNLDFFIHHNRKTYWYCGVLVKGVNRIYSYISDSGYIEPDSFVEVPFGGRNKPRIGIVEYCHPRMEENAPYPVNQTKHIIRIATEEEYNAQGALEPYRWDKYDDEGEEIDWLIECGDWDRVFEWAVDHHDSKDPKVLEKVIDCYNLCMQQNMPTAALNLGTFYYTGRVVEQDYKKAFELYRIAADAGERRAICNCGYCFYYGRHQEVDYREAYRYFSLGALLFNDANCLYKLGDLFMSGYGVEKNEKYAFMVYNRALQQCQKSEEDCFSTADALFRVGKCLLRGIGVEKDTEEAHRLLCASLVHFYKRRQEDPFISGLIQNTKELISEAQAELDAD